MMRMSVPFSSRWVAKLCRRVCTVTRLAKPAAAHAERQAECSNLGINGLALVAPWKQPEAAGRVSRQ